MKKPKFLFIVVLSVFMCFSCANENEEIKDKENPSFGLTEQTDGNKFSRSIDEAVDDLYIALEMLYPETRAEGRTISSIETVEGRRAIRMTRSDDDIVDSLIPDKAFYFVNFQEGGFAVLGADTRLEAVYVIAELGSISSNIFNIVTDDGEFSENEEDYYDAELDDYLIGSLPNNDNINNNVLGNMLSNAVVTPVSGWTTSLSDDAEVYYYIGPEIVLSTKTVIHKQIRSLLTTKWKQGFPFNTYCPNNTAGCVPIALAQIMLHNEYPPYIIYNGVKLFMSEMKTVWGLNSAGKIDKKRNTIAADRAARFVRLLGREVYAVYIPMPGGGSNPTFAFPVFAAKALKNYGYNVNFNKGNVDKAVFIRMLETDRPIFYSAYPKGHPFKGHAWIIDGYYNYSIIRRVKQLVRSSKGEYYREGETTWKYEYFHCNWGWGGNGDGYYSLSLLNPNNGPNQVDYIDTIKGTTESENGGKYDTHIRWIYYTKPNK